MSGKLYCPECNRPVQQKNIKNHFLRYHPGLDPYESLKAARVPGHVKEPRYEVRGSSVAYVLIVVAVIVMIVISFFMYRSLTHEEERIGPRNVFFTSEDGAIINATWYDTGIEGSPTVYLVHEIGQTREVWEKFAENIRGKGYNALAMDLRGHGDSRYNVKDRSIYYDVASMDDQDFIDIGLDFIGAYRWVHGVDLEDEPNTGAGEDGALVGIGKGGLLAFQKASRMSRERVMSASVLSPVLTCYGMDVPQAYEDWGDIRPVMVSCGSLDGTSLAAVEKIKERTPEKGVQVIVGGNERGLALLEYPEVREGIYETLDDGFTLEISA